MIYRSERLIGAEDLHDQIIMWMGSGIVLFGIHSARLVIGDTWRKNPHTRCLRQEVPFDTF